MYPWQLSQQELKLFREENTVLGVGTGNTFISKVGEMGLPIWCEGALDWVPRGSSGKDTMAWSVPMSSQALWKVQVQGKEYHLTTFALHLLVWTEFMRSVSSLVLLLLTLVQHVFCSVGAVLDEREEGWEKMEDISKNDWNVRYICSVCVNM